MVQLMHPNLGATLAQAESIKGQRQQNRLAELLQPYQVQRQQAALTGANLANQQQQGQISDQQIKRMTLLTKVFKDSLGDGFDQLPDEEKALRWQTGMGNIEALGADMQGMPLEYSPEGMDFVNALSERLGIGGSIQSTYVDDAGNRVAIFRDGSTRVLGSSETSYKYDEDLGGFVDRRTGKVYAPGETPNATAPTPTGSTTGGGLSPEEIERRRQEEDRRRVQLEEDKAGAKVRGKTSAEIALGESKAGQKVLSTVTQIDTVLDTIDEALNLTGGMTAGVGAVLSAIPGTPARDLERQILTIKANIGFDRLQQMRDLSPTGGALGNVANQELEALQATISSLDNTQSPSQLRSNLRKIQMHYQNWRDAVVESHADQYGEAPNVPQRSGEQQDVNALIDKWSQ